MRHLLVAYLERLALDRWAHQGVRRLIRAGWVVACVWCVGLGGHVLWGWVVRLHVLGVLTFVVIGVALLLLLRPRISVFQVARRLDRRFHLDEQLASALEVLVRDPIPQGVAARLVEQAGQTVRLVRRSVVRRQRPPWDDVVVLVSAWSVALGLFVSAGVEGSPRDVAVLPLPPLVSSGAQGPLVLREGAPISSGPAVSPSGGEMVVGLGDSRAVAVLADALRDEGMTRSVAEALDRGDTVGAAQELRVLADQAGGLSLAARGDVADALRAAADRLGFADVSLAEQVRGVARDLIGDDDAVAQALDDLSHVVERLGRGMLAGQEGGGSGLGGADQGAVDEPVGEQREDAWPRRLGVAGQPIEVEVSGEGAIVFEPTDRSPTMSLLVPGVTQGEGKGDAGSLIGGDPLRVPLGERDVVQGYFTP